MISMLLGLGGGGCLVGWGGKNKKEFRQVRRTKKKRVFKKRINWVGNLTLCRWGETIRHPLLMKSIIQLGPFLFIYSGGC